MKLDYFPSKKDEKPAFSKEASLSSQTSTWMAKRQRNKVEKDVEILRHRITLLSHLESKAKKKVKEMKEKTDKIIEIKETIESQNSAVLNSIKFLSFFLIQVFLLRKNIRKAQQKKKKN